MMIKPVIHHCRRYDPFERPKVKAVVWRPNKNAVFQAEVCKEMRRKSLRLLPKEAFAAVFASLPFRSPNEQQVRRATQSVSGLDMSAPADARLKP